MQVPPAQRVQGFVVTEKKENYLHYPTGTYPLGPQEEENELMLPPCVLQADLECNEVEGHTNRVRASQSKEIL